MNNFKRKKAFIRFLKENNCYKIFEYNLRIHIINVEYFECHSIDELVNKAIKNDLFLNELMISFDWCKTNEGREFWCDLHLKWCDILYNINKKTYD